MAAHRLLGIRQSAAPLAGAPSRIDPELHRDGFHDECGVFGVFRNSGASALTALGLHALQHRGQEAAGIVACDRGQFRVERHMGLVDDTSPRRTSSTG